MAVRMNYRPIDCSLHDRLEAAATLGRTCTVAYRQDDAIHVIEDVIVDVFARAGAEYLKTASGLEIRLDRVEALNGMPFHAEA